MPDSLDALDVDLGQLAGRVIAQREIPGREAIHAPLPADLDPALKTALAAQGIEQLYSHQRESYDLARAQRDLVVTTGTASGKSLSFLLPVLQGMVEDPSARAFLIYPTKALARDQLRAVLRHADRLRAGGDGRPLGAGVYDGDTPPNERKRIRERANLVLTNPDMLNAALLPAHGRQGYSHLFRCVRWIVIDEMHVYRGAFGAHFANLMRRLLRVCAHYGSRPQFLASSATIANPDGLARSLVGRPFAHVSRDGSPSSGKRVLFWQPPKIHPSGGDARRPVTAELTTLLPELIQQRQKTIAFCRSRKTTEVVLKETRDRLRQVNRNHDESSLVAAYRGGYTPAERRRVEQDLLEGRLVAVVSTNALELGVDIGQLEVVVQAGFPGTRASFWQQLGRAGRRGKRALGVVILDQAPVDQYIAADPDWLVGRPAERAVVDPDNLTVQLAHLRCAAAELPLSLDDAAIWPDLAEAIPVLAAAGELREVYGAWHWTGGAFPAGDFSLRLTDGDRFKVVDRTLGRTLCEMTRPQVYREAHTRAIYLHGGVQYQVEALDLVAHVATVVPVEQNFYTQPDVRTQIETLALQERKACGREGVRFGDVRVDEAVVGYKMMEFHNHQNLGYERLHQDLSLSLETEAVWWLAPEEVLAALGRESRDVVRGMAHALGAVARMRTMAERSDLVATSFRVTDGDAVNTSVTRTAIVCYDTHPGGIGFAATAYDLAAELVDAARTLVRDCACDEGCPACVGGYSLPRAIVRWALDSLIAPTPAPPELTQGPASRPVPGPAAPAAPALDWQTLPASWPQVRARLDADAASGVAGAAMLAAVASVDVRGDTLVLQLSSPELARWVERDRARLREVLARHVGPRMEGGHENDWRLAAELGEATPATERRRHRLRHRLEDVKRDDPETERAANERLASGFELPGTRPAPPSWPEGGRPEPAVDPTGATTDGLTDG